MRSCLEVITLALLIGTAGCAPYRVHQVTGVADSEGGAWFLEVGSRDDHDEMHVVRCLPEVEECWRMEVVGAPDR
jgi:hypothetical protein